MKRLAIAFSGPSNCGKTTLITKLSYFFKNQGLKVAIIKHDPKNKASFDEPGKDSFKFFNTGADTVVLSPKKTVLFSHDSSDDDLKTAIYLLKDFDILMVEGLKTLDLPRILVFKDELDTSYFDKAKAIASYQKCEALTWLHLDDIEEIAKYILKNAKGV